jgi:hypothetical protein
MVLSEKTLEINFVRNFKHSSHFVWQGATLREEARGGWDVAINNLMMGRSFILQFKRPYSVKKIQGSKTLFTFYINNNNNRDQNQLLSNIAQQLGPMNVFYALPCVEDISDLTSPREAILWRTALADIHQLNLANLSQGIRHKIEISYNHHPTNPSFSGLVYSEPKELNIITINDYKEWVGFNLPKLKDLGKFPTDIVKSKRIRVKLLTEIPGTLNQNNESGIF